MEEYSIWLNFYNSGVIADFYAQRIYLLGNGKTIPKDFLFIMCANQSITATISKATSDRLE